MKPFFRLIFWASLLALTACGAGKGKEDSNPTASSIRSSTSSLMNSVSSAVSSQSPVLSSQSSSSLVSSSAISSIRTSVSSASIISSSSKSASSSLAISSSIMSSSSRSSVASSSSRSASSSSLASSLSSQASSKSSSRSSTNSSTVGTPGVWQNVTDPTRMNMDPQSNPDGNYGAISIMLDPVRPSDLYATICYQGLWKSTDYGVTWNKVSTGINGDKLDLGRASMSIDPNPNRDPNTPPTFFTNSLYGGIAQGLWKSTNGGKDWTYIWNVVKAADGVTDIKQAVGSDVSVPVVDPSDGQHLIVSMHGSVGYGDHIFESLDGGASWIDKGPTGMNFLSLFLIDRTTWIVQGDYFASGNTLRTRNSGATWEFSGAMAHAHGGASLLNLGNGELYLGGIGVNQGLYHSINSGDSWVRVPNSTDTSAMVATASRIYTSYGWAYLAAPIPPVLGHVDRTGNTWVADPDPQGMINGAVNMVATNDGNHDIILGVFYNAGIWRYVEP